MANPFVINKFINPYLNRNKNPYIMQRQQGALTPSQAELYGYVQKEKAEKEKQINWMQPLELIFDLLSRGQYLTANIGQDIGRAISGEGNVTDILKGAWEGITGKRKGTWEKTFFGGKDVGEEIEGKGWFQNTPDWMKAEAKIPIIGPTSIQDVIGFLGDVFLDPTTYISFGSSKAAEAAAQNYAEKAVIQTLKQAGNIDNIAKFAQKSFNKGKFLKILQKGKKGVTEATEYLGKHAAKKDIARFMSQVTKTAYKEGLSLTPDMVQKTFTKNLLADQARYIDDTAKALVGQGKSTAKKAAKESLEALKKTGEFESLSHLDELIKTVSKKRMGAGELEKIYKEILEAGKGGGLKAIEFMPEKVGKKLSYLDDYVKQLAETQSPEFMKQFAGMGERTMRFFGQELFTGVRQKNIVSRTFDTFMTGLKKTKVGGKLSDAVWSVMNTGPVGKLRKMFGFRNPYQQMLHLKGMDVQHAGEVYKQRAVYEIHDIISKYNDDIQDGVKKAISAAEEIKPENISEILSKPAILEKLGIDEKNVDEIKKAVGELKGITDKFHNIEGKLAEEGLAPENVGYLEYYLPKVTQNPAGIKGKMTVRGSYSHGFQQTRKMSLIESETGEIMRLKTFLGVDEKTADYMVNKLNWSTVNMNLEEMLIHRAIAHSQVVTHANLVREFKQFGIKFGGNAPGAAISKTDFFADLNPVDVERNQGLFRFLRTQGQDIPDLGLRQINHPALEGMYFDKDVSDVIDRVVSITGSDEGLNWFLQKAGAFTAWWKGWAVGNPGFIMRNHFTNRGQLFMWHGVSSLNPKRGIEAWIGTAKALYGDAFLKKFQFGDTFIQNRLKTIRAGKSIEEWADIAEKLGHITRATYAFDPKDIIEELTKSKSLAKKLNIASNENIIFEKLREVNAIVESSAKFEGFLIDLEKMAGKNGVATDAMIQQASKNTKKWLFDYEDLTEFEQKIMKNIIPFYTWLRKNVALQMTQMVENHQMYSVVAKAMRGIQVEGVDVQDLPEYMREAGYIPTEVTGEGKVRTWWPNMPWSDINKLPFRFEVNEAGIPLPKWTPQEIVEEFLSSANPVLKTFAEVLGSEKGYDFFRKKDLDSQSVAPRVMRLFAANPQMLGFMDSLIKGIGYKDGLEARKDQQGRLVIDSKIQKILENNFIVLERLDQSWDALTTIVPQLEDAAAKFTGYENKYQGLDKYLRVISFIFGIKERELDLEQEKLYRFKEILKDAETARAKERRKKPGYEQRTREYLQREKRTMRRYGLY